LPIWLEADNHVRIKSGANVPTLPLDGLPELLRLMRRSFRIASELDDSQAQTTCSYRCGSRYGFAD